MSMDDYSNYTLGDSSEELETDDSDAVRAIALSIAVQSHRTLDIVSRHLDPALYDTQPFVEAVKELALRSRHSRIRLLVTDPAPLVSQGHRLLELAQRLSTFIEVRVPDAEHRQFNEAWLIADETAFIKRQFADRFEGIANFSDRRRARELTRAFDEMWEHARPDSNLRRLHI